jgi:hypothetical protein
MPGQIMENRGNREIFNRNAHACRRSLWRDERLKLKRATNVDHKPSPEPSRCRIVARLGRFGMAHTFQKSATPRFLMQIHKIPLMIDPLDAPHL